MRARLTFAVAVLAAALVATITPSVAAPGFSPKSCDYLAVGVRNTHPRTAQNSLFAPISGFAGGEASDDPRCAKVPLTGTEHIVIGKPTLRVWTNGRRISIGKTSVYVRLGRSYRVVVVARWHYFGMTYVHTTTVTSNVTPRDGRWKWQRSGSDLQTFTIHAPDSIDFTLHWSVSCPVDESTTSYFTVTDDKTYRQPWKVHTRSRSAYRSAYFYNEDGARYDLDATSFCHWTISAVGGDDL